MRRGSENCSYLPLHSPGAPSSAQVHYGWLFQGRSWRTVWREVKRSGAQECHSCCCLRKSVKQKECWWSWENIIRAGWVVKWVKSLPFKNKALGSITESMYEKVGKVETGRSLELANQPASSNWLAHINERLVSKHKVESAWGITSEVVLWLPYSWTSLHTNHAYTGACTCTLVYMCPPHTQGHSWFLLCVGQ